MVAAVVPPVVGGLVGAVASNVAAAVVKLIGNRYNYWSNFDEDIVYLRRELIYISKARDDQLSEKHDLSEMRPSMEIEDLAFEIEDFLDHIQRYVVERDGPTLHAFLGFLDQPQLEDKVKKLKKRLKNAYQRKTDHKHEVVNGSQQPSATSAALLANTYRPSTEFTPVGIDESKQEIREWVMKDVTKGQPEQLSVISIVGFRGSGKSTLAKAVCDSDDVKKQFPHRVWVVASKHGDNIKGLLMELLEKLGHQRDQISDSEDIQPLRAKISTYLKNTDERYLIVLDDIKDQSWWLGIQPALPKKATVRIIVTTTIQTLAIACRSGDGYVHNMAALEVHHSMKVMTDILDRPSTGLDGGSIVKKCDGNPHAVVAAANYLLRKDVISKTDCEQLSQKLGRLMATDSALKQLENVLMNSYKSLPCKEGSNLKTCLLYLCVFPNGCHIRCSRLMRRCLAEGYVLNDSDAMKVPDELRDQSVIRPIDSRKNGSVKTCRAHGFFHEFLLDMSKSAKFITSLDEKDSRDYRHLFIQNKSRGMAAGGEEKKLRAHSLTICGNAGEAVGYFDKCHLLGVLDLEECNDLEDEQLDGIHKLWHLKYLSVGNSISRLPKDIEKLHCLETLDMRKAKEEIILLPVEVLKMPHIAHLLGRFKLDSKQKWDESQPQQYVPATSNLQTLAGFVTDENPMFQKLMDQMKQSSKVKIWAIWRDQWGEDPYIISSITKFVLADLGTGRAVRSLSLDIGNSSGSIPRYLAHCVLRSLKLHGDMSALVDFFALKLELCYVKELCLSSLTNNNNLTGIDLSPLRKLKYLEYLKLVGIRISPEGFVIESEDFKDLLRLCLVQCPSLPTIRNGALPNLLSLRLLNQGLVGLSDIDIEHHECLQEVALDSKVNSETKKEWQDAAKKHPRKPKILFFERVNPDETGCRVKYVATERPPRETESPMVGMKGNSDAVQSGSCVETNSGLKQIKLSEASAASTEQPTARDDGIPPSSSAYPNRGNCILSNGKLRVSKSF